MGHAFQNQHAVSFLQHMFSECMRLFKLMHPSVAVTKVWIEIGVVFSVLSWPFSLAGDVDSFSPQRTNKKLLVSSTWIGCVYANVVFTMKDARVFVAWSVLKTALFGLRSEGKMAS